MEYIHTKIGHRIRVEREKSGLSQDELISRINISRNTLSACENGKKMLQLGDMLKLCAIFDCELSYLLCEHDNKTRAATDVQMVTGLSACAVNSLIKYKDKSDGEKVAFSVILQILSSFIESEDSLIEVARTLIEYENIRTDLDRMEAVSEDLLLVSGESAKKFLIYNLQQKVLEILLKTAGDDFYGT